MRLTLPLAAALTAASVVLPGPASAAGCTAVAEPPRASGGQVYGEGAFACAAVSLGAFVTVCIDVLWMDNPPGFGAHTCSDLRVDNFTQVVVHGVWACAQDGPLVRTTITGTNGDGETATASSVPVPAPVGSCGP